jgi:hypothetical protein
VWTNPEAVAAQATNGGIGGQLDLLRLDQADPRHVPGYPDGVVERRGASREGDDPLRDLDRDAVFARFRMRGQGHPHPRGERAGGHDLPSDLRRRELGPSHEPLDELDGGGVGDLLGVDDGVVKGGVRRDAHAQHVWNPAQEPLPPAACRAAAYRTDIQ